MATRNADPILERAMKARERQNAERVGVVRPSATLAAAAPKSRPEPVDLGPLTVWENWLRHAAPNQQLEILTLASRQGFVSLDQLPDANGPPTNPTPAGSVFLNQWLNGQVAPAPAPLSTGQSPALTRALETPDFCLWQRGPGIDAAPLAAELLRRAVREGRRVLFLAQTVAPLERVLQLLSEDADFLAMRFTAPGESAANGPLTRFTMDDQRQALRRRMSAASARLIDDLRSHANRFDAEQAAWDQLDRLREQILDGEQRLPALRTRREHLEVEVRREATGVPGSDRVYPSGPFSSELLLRQSQADHSISALEKKLLPITDRAGILDGALNALRREREPVVGMVEARRHGRWWTLSYWQSLFCSALIQRDGEKEQRQRAVEAELKKLEGEAAGIRAEIDGVERARVAEQAELVKAEIGRRRDELTRHVDTLTFELDQARSRWTECRDAIREPADRPMSWNDADPEAARRRWLERGKTEQANAVFAKQWGAFLEESTAGFVERLPKLAPVLAGTAQALAKSPDFAAAAADSTFDLLVLDEADRFTEVELRTLLAKARRWLLIGAPESGDGRTCAVRPGPFHKLWHLLHPSEPRPFYTWSTVGDQLGCTLRPIAEAETAFVESERLADFPEIELRILVTPNVRPRLAQVLFPASMPLPQAKAFIYRELQEVAIDRLERPTHWEKTATGLSLHWHCPMAPAELMVELEPGIHEWICTSGPDFTTCRLEFADSWPAAKITDWLRRYLGFVDTGRTAVVDRE